MLAMDRDRLFTLQTMGRQAFPGPIMCLLLWADSLLLTAEVLLLPELLERDVVLVLATPVVPGPLRSTESDFVTFEPRRPELLEPGIAEIVV